MSLLMTVCTTFCCLGIRNKMFDKSVFNLKVANYVFVIDYFSFYICLQKEHHGYAMLSSNIDMPFVQISM